MDDYLQPIIHLIPEKWRGTAAFLVAVSPLLTRAYHSVVNGGGMRGAISAIWLGTNTPNTPKSDTQNENKTPPSNPT